MGTANAGRREPSSEARGLASRPSPQDCPVAAGATLAKRAAGVVARIRKQRCDNRIGRRSPVVARRFRYHRLRDAIRQSGGQRAGSASLRSEWWRTRTSRLCRPSGRRTSAATHARSARSPGLRTFRRAGFHRTRAEAVLTLPVLMGSSHRPTTGSPGRVRSCLNCWTPQGLSEEQVAPPPFACSPCTARRRACGVPLRSTISGGMASRHRSAFRLATLSPRGASDPFDGIHTSEDRQARTRVRQAGCPRVPFAANHVPWANQEPAPATNLLNTRVMDIIATSRSSGKTRTFDNAQDMVCYPATPPGTPGAARRSGRSGRLQG